MSSDGSRENQVVPHLGQAVDIDELLDVVRGPFS
jgi:hypothetical protein